MGKSKPRQFEFYCTRGPDGLTYAIPPGKCANPMFEHFGNGEGKTAREAYLNWWRERTKRKPEPKIIATHCGGGVYRLEMEVEE